MTIIIEEPSEQPREMLYVQIHAAIASKVNLANFQNAVPVVHELSVINESTVEIKELRLTISSEPTFMKPKVWHIDHIAAGQTVRINELDLGLNGALLSRLNEAEKAVATLALTAKDGAQIASYESTVELLPRNQWGGLSTLPYMIAAFVQPNEPTIERVLKQAADVLRKAGKPGALDGYQGGARRAWELASGIWNAIGAMGLDYALPPASFEHMGQKVRSPSQIADSGLGTCLDIALFVCSALEQAGLNTVLVFTHGHAFPGVWLKAEEFSTPIVDDITALRKRIKLKELILFESTLLTHRPLPSFSYAITRGEEQISEEEESKFQLAVDIRRARLQRIRPLASEQAIECGTVDAKVENIQPIFEHAPDLPDELDVNLNGNIPEHAEDRLTRWQRKLLDLSLRNNLLSFKAGKKSLKLDAPDPARLEDLLAEGHSIKLLVRPDLMDGSDIRDQAIYESRERENLRRHHALDALKRKEMFVGLAQDEMDTRLVELYRTSRTTLQEGGSNTLYLALGFLSWTRDDKDSKKYRAPLILLPVSLDRRSAQSGFSLKMYDDEPRFNPTLLEMLRQDFELELGVHDTELPKDDSGLDVTGIWKTVSNAIKNVKGWEVVEDVVLATFSFAKYLMWKDLTECIDQLKQNAVVRHLIETPRDSYENDIEFPDPRRLDFDLRVKETFCPLPADSSQLSAVFAGSKGKDFVLIGPPGTGKSQTISNLIAQCLGERKRVLFVSEKMAALDVVYRRLADVGLGNFCLELHSSKARKTDVLEQLRTSWDAVATMAPDHWHAEACRLDGLRAQLNDYVERLHLRHPNGLSVYEAIGKVIVGCSFPILPLSWSSVKIHDLTAICNLREAAELLDVHAKVMGKTRLTENPLAHVVQTEWSPFWQSTLLDAARTIGPIISKFETASQVLMAAIGLPALPLTARIRDGLRLLAETLLLASGHDWKFVLRPDAKTLADNLRLAVPLVMRHRELHVALSSPKGNHFLEDLRLGITQLIRHSELHSQLSESWNESLRSRLASGIELLSSRQKLITQLTLPYRENIASAIIQQLQYDWRELQESSWPMSLVRRRAMTKKLKELATEGGEPDIGIDVDCLVKIDILQTEIKSLDDLSLLTSGVWAGLKTEIDVARASLGFQSSLANARLRLAWEDVGLDPVSRGHCGEAAREDLQRMREMRQIDQAMNRLKALSEESDGVWNGYETSPTVAKAYIVYQEALSAAHSNSDWKDEGLAVIENGLAGATAVADLRSMRELAALQNRLKEFANLSTKTDGLWSGLQTKIDNIEPALKFFKALSGAIAVVSNTPETLTAVKTIVVSLLGVNNLLLEPTGTISGAVCQYVDALQELDSAVTRFALASGLPESDKSTLRELLPTELAQRAGDVLNTSNRLNAWCAWRKARQQALILGLAPLVTALEQGDIVAGQVKDAFETAYSRWWLNAVVDDDEILRTFVSAEHEKRIKDFRELDEQFIRLTQAWVQAQLSVGHPSPERVSRGSEWGLLRYEMQKKTRHLPLRELMSQASNAVIKLTPCLLMSPLSIAQYLPADTAKFDVVIFDEASQIPVWDAIGAMARAKQVIMVGDPKQLPPTSFFDRAESDVDDTDVETELESILEECIGANLPTMKLSWHYRSRHESLIAFSNHRYYQGELVTFPSPMTNGRAVSFTHVSNGQYERGGARINKIEAKTLVADLVGRIKSPGFRDSRMTIGVVTFNAEQQRLIEDLLDEERRKDSSIESHFLDTQLEPIFIKNLESVQGDERDIIYFSITYGPGIDGQMPMQFGPMNQQGGERRLNVAITRARQELRVFGSFRPEQMDLSRTQALGVRDLKHFLEFAIRGARALGEANVGSIGDFDSPFERAVSIALTEKGWTLHSQVGVSTFRIDLGVVDPDAPGRYLAGIECDGATYHRSATARDRDKLREQVLRGLGWEILRIWSTDWWLDMPGTVDKIHAELQALLTAQKGAREKSREEASREAQQVIADAMIGSAKERSGITTSIIVSDNNAEPFQPESQLVAMYAGKVTTTSADTVYNDVVPKQFIEVDLTIMDNEFSAEAFFDETYDPQLLNMIEKIVNTEGPVRDEVLARRIARAHGWGRTGARIQDRIVLLASQHYQSQREDIGIFFWAKGEVANSPIQFRRSTDGTPRPVNEISLAELGALASEMKRDGHDQESGVVAMAREIGLRKLSAASRSRLELAWKNTSVSLTSGNDV